MSGIVFQRFGVAGTLLGGAMTGQAAAGRQGPVENPPVDLRGSLSLFILAGQSNMSGRGDLHAEPAHQRMFMFANDYRWKIANEPVDSAEGQVDLVAADTKAPIAQATRIAPRRSRSRRSARPRFPAAVASDPDTRVPALDGVRGVAILLVLFHHIVIFSGMTRESDVDRILRILGNASWIGVDLFFVLSGFLITGILYDAKGSPTYFTSFYGRRILRIFPLYYGFLALTFGLAPMWMADGAPSVFTSGQAWYWTYLSNVQVAISGWQPPLHISHFWSLAIEEQFYLIWPFVVVALDRRQLIRVGIACVLVAVVLRLVVFWQLSPLAGYVLMPTRMDSLAVGALLALVMRGPAREKGLGAWPIGILACGISASGMLFLWRRGFNELDPVVSILGYSLFAVTFAALIATVLGTRTTFLARRALCWPPLLVFGQYSYGLYVFHQPIALLMREGGWDANVLPRLWGSQLPGLVVYGASVAAVSMTCAVISWHAWESRFLRLKRHFPYRPAVDPVIRAEGRGLVSTP